MNAVAICACELQIYNLAVIFLSFLLLSPLPLLIMFHWI